MIAEDNQDYREILSFILEERGFKIIQAENGLEGLNKFQLMGNMIDLVLTDLNMPEMNGYEMLTEIKKISPDQKSVIMSSTHAAFIKANPNVSPDIFIIHKPVEYTELICLISEVLEN